jgi:hypothetical protein
VPHVGHAPMIERPQQSAEDDVRFRAALPKRARRRLGGSVDPAYRLLDDSVTVCVATAVLAGSGRANIACTGPSSGST